MAWKVTPQSPNNHLKNIPMKLTISYDVMNDIIDESSLRDFRKYPKWVENSKYVLESSFLVIFDSFTNLVVYLANYEYRMINKSLNLGNIEIYQPLIASSLRKN